MVIRFFYVDQRNSDTEHRTSPTEPMAENTGGAGGVHLLSLYVAVWDRYAAIAVIRIDKANSHSRPGSAVGEVVRCVNLRPPRFYCSLTD